MTTITRAMGWLAAMAAAAVLGGCAAPGHGMHGMHGMHGGGGGQGMNCPMHADMQQKMAAAKTPEERQKLMAEHHQAMGGAGGAGGMSCPMMQPAAK